MADNKGIFYEKTLNDNLKKYKIQSVQFQPAGSDSNAPDAELLYKDQKYKVEVKLDMNVDFGQGSLDYDVAEKKWILGGGNTESAKQMRQFLTAMKVPDLVNSKWGPKGPPRKFTVPLNKFKQEDVDHDYRKFTNEFINIPQDAVSNYYASKQTYYIQIGAGYGLYHMTKDPAKLGVPAFKPQLKLRIRLKRGGSFPIYNYRFSTAIVAVTGSLSKSSGDLDDIEYLKTLRGRSQ